MRVVGEWVLDEPRDDDEQREQHHRDHEPELNRPIVAKLDAPYPLSGPSVLSSWPTRRLRYDA
jgi:hypothetical protein